MVLISFLYIVTTKVIQHNLEKKVPMYVYYLYKNLENESKLLTKKLLDQTNQENSSSGSNSEEEDDNNENNSQQNSTDEGSNEVSNDQVVHQIRQ